MNRNTLTGPQKDFAIPPDYQAQIQICTNIIYIFLWRDLYKTDRAAKCTFTLLSHHTNRLKLRYDRNQYLNFTLI